MREGSGGGSFYVIESGEASVLVRGEERAKLGPGDHFGEIALIDEGARTASITAVSELVCYGMTLWDFRPLVERNGSSAGSSCRRSRRYSATRSKLRPPDSPRAGAASRYPANRRLAEWPTSSVPSLLGCNVRAPQKLRWLLRGWWRRKRFFCDGRGSRG